MITDAELLDGIVRRLRDVGNSEQLLKRAIRLLDINNASANTIKARQELINDIKMYLKIPE